MASKQVLRCAIYTRKSSEEGLEQDFNSLHAQREACEAFIASQKHEGWILHPEHYDDGGFSGGNMQRPALTLLMQDITARKINVVVVYKVDRLTRSLADFAKIVEQFDQQQVSFVSVTQQFNTTSSMGRLTLNVLLSFAQFEREVTGERIRDKIAASKKKGMWMGGVLSLGYDVVERKLIINSAEAKTVRYMFQRYLELGSVRLLQEEMVSKNIRSKTTKHPTRPGGKFMSRGAIYRLLSNPIYIGQIQHKGTLYTGQQEAIIDQELWDKVQANLKNNAVNRYDRSNKSAPSLLLGKLFDESGEGLGPTHSCNNGKYYRYYVSKSLLTTTGKNDKGWRLPAREIEQIVVNATKRVLNDASLITSTLHESGIDLQFIPSAINAASAISKEIDLPQSTASIFKNIIERVELGTDGIKLTLSIASLIPNSKDSPAITITHHIPMIIKRRGSEMKLVIGNGAITTNHDPVLIKTIACAHAWAEDLLSGNASSMIDIASQNNVSVSYVKKLMPLAFLAPKIVEDIIKGQQPAAVNKQKLIRSIDLPTDWKVQEIILNA